MAGREPTISEPSSYMKAGRTSILLAIFYGWLGSGCALQTPREDAATALENVTVISPSSIAAEEAAEPETPKPPTRAIPAETLYSLLAAELAGSREQYDIALNNYAQQARETQDPQVAERATMIARYLNANDIARETARLWVELAPDSDEALGNASVVLMQNGDLLEAFEMSRRLQARGRESLYQSIAANAGTISREERQQLLDAYLAQLAVTPKDEQLLIGTGLLLQLQGQPEEARRYSQQAFKLYPRSVSAALLDTNLLHQLNRSEEALAKMAKLLEIHPDNLRLRLQYARILAHHGLPQAQQQFEILVRQNPDDRDLLLSLALVASEAKDYGTAASTFERLLDLNEHVSTSHFYLGQIAELRADPAKALLHYLQVEEGEHFLQATVNLVNILIQKGDLVSAAEHIARITAANPAQTDNYALLHAQALARHDHTEAAEQVLSQALTRSPKNTRLLYSRAMLYERQNRLAATERDLQTIIQLEPDNAIALNTLGYLWVDRGERLGEARELLMRAIALTPDDPAIIDSVGWLHFRTGNYPEALTYLRRAFQLHPDAEIAAHLGEVLWVIDRQDEALEIWQKGLQLPDNDIIQRTMERLQAPQP